MTVGGGTACRRPHVLLNQAERKGSPMRDDSGATAAEYAIVAALIAVGIAAAVGALGSSVSDLFTNPTLHDALAP